MKFATKANLKNIASVNTSKFAKKIDLASLKSNIDKLDIDKLINVPSKLNNLKGKVDELDVNKLAPVFVDLRKLIDLVKNDVVKKDVYNAKIENIEDKIPDITDLAISTTLNAKINKVKNKIPRIINLATTAAANANINEVKNRIYLILLS